MTSVENGVVERMTELMNGSMRRKDNRVREALLILILTHPPLPARETATSRKACMTSCQEQSHTLQGTSPVLHHHRFGRWWRGKGKRNTPFVLQLHLVETKGGVTRYVDPVSESLARRVLA